MRKISIIKVYDHYDEPSVYEKFLNDSLWMEVNEEDFHEIKGYVQYHNMKYRTDYNLVIIEHIVNENKDLLFKDIKEWKESVRKQKELEKKQREEADKKRKEKELEKKKKQLEKLKKELEDK